MNNLNNKRLNLIREVSLGEREKANLKSLKEISVFWAYPGMETIEKMLEYLENGQKSSLRLLSRNLYESIKNKSYLKQDFLPFYSNLKKLNNPKAINESNEGQNKYFEVLLVHPNKVDFENIYRKSLGNYKNEEDGLLYDIVVVDNYEDAVIAILANPDIQTCLYMDGFKTKSNFNKEAEGYYKEYIDSYKEKKTAIDLKKKIYSLRPELDHIYISEGVAEKEINNNFKHTVDINSYEFYGDLNYHIVNGINYRQDTPFFNALCSYSRKPKVNFHALPISQGASFEGSVWMEEVSDFYGNDVFSAETSSTLGGLDSLMDPKGSISQAQNKASELFQSKKTFFITNGTTSANKIVMQANLRPNDIVLISSDCHKSIPYSILLAGANPVFLETYPLEKYDLYGCVTLERIKSVLLDLKEQGKLELVKQITLTNSTFDGLVYNVEKYMLEILEIKPDIIFHWDEAWFSFAGFNPLYIGQCSMHVAKKLSEKEGRKFKLRVYATQSVHKTMSAFRQASMLHIYDEEFNENNFYEAYRTHTSTSPNYQIIASLDFARKQMSLEGYSLVQKSIDLSFQLRKRINQSRELNKYFKVLTAEDIVPEELRVGEGDIYLDPTRITIDIRGTGIDGYNFRQILMTQYDIQINKTSRNTILFIINIGINQSNIDYLIDSLEHVSSQLSSKGHNIERPKEIDLPQTRKYNSRFVPVKSESNNNFEAVNIRLAYYDGLDEENVCYRYLDGELMQEVLKENKVVSASFVTPYPPGFPIIVPGQIITYDILLYLQSIKISEIHGYNSSQGLKVFKENFLKGEK